MPEQHELTQHTDFLALGDSIESQLAQIWQSVLNIRRIGLRENFFELGGHSLLVAKLLRRIEQRFGKKLSMASMFQAPTIEQQAFMLRNNSALFRPSGVVPIQPAGSKPPFFCFGYGAGPVFLPLARRLGPDQPVLGIDPTLLEATQLPASCNMEDIATHIAKQIREMQLDGPYYLGGVCGGGLVAYETARQLVAQGQQVALLALFEPHTAYRDCYVLHSTGFGPRWLGRRLKFHVGNLRQLESTDAKDYVRDHIRERSRVFFGYLNERFWNVFGDLRPKARNGRRTRIRNILGTAYHAYCPRPFTGPLLLFQATRREPGTDWERQYWHELANRLQVYEVSGYSNWLVRFFMEPNVEILANRLRSYLPTDSKAAFEGS